MKWFLDVLRGMVIGLANVIPGVSGGTMMVSMGIYDKLIYSINNLFKKFRECFKILLPYLLGMGIAIILGSVALKVAFESYPLPTNTLFIGLILGSLPIILKQIKGEKLNVLCAIIFIIFAAIVIVPKFIANTTLVGDNVNGGNQALTADVNGTPALPLDFGHIVIYFLLGVLASASMVVPGISGSMMLKIFGYYEPIVTKTIGTMFKEAIPAGNWDLVLHSVLVLLPFGIGIVVGIFGVAKLIEFMLNKWKVYTYCAILGMVVASPVVILMDPAIYIGFNLWIGLASVVALMIGVFCAIRLGGE